MNLNLIIFLLISLIFQQNHSEISDKRLCIDLECSKPISEATVLFNYASPEKGILSAKGAEKVTIYSYPAGKRIDLYGIEYKGKRGYFPKSAIRENKVFAKPSKLVATELPEEPNVDIKPHRAQTIIAGTTIHADYYAADENKVPAANIDPVPIAKPIDSSQNIIILPVGGQSSVKDRFEFVFNVKFNQQSKSSKKSLEKSTVNIQINERNPASNLVQNSLLNNVLGGPKDNNVDEKPKNVLPLIEKEIIQDYKNVENVKDISADVNITEKSNNSGLANEIKNETVTLDDKEPFNLLENKTEGSIFEPLKNNDAINEFNSKNTNINEKEVNKNEEINFKYLNITDDTEKNVETTSEINVIEETIPKTLNTNEDFFINEENHLKTISPSEESNENIKEQNNFLLKEEIYEQTTEKVEEKSFEIIEETKMTLEESKNEEIPMENPQEIQLNDTSFEIPVEETTNYQEESSAGLKVIEETTNYQEESSAEVKEIDETTNYQEESSAEAKVIEEKEEKPSEGIFSWFQTATTENPTENYENSYEETNNDVLLSKVSSIGSSCDGSAQQCPSEEKYQQMQPSEFSDAAFDFSGFFSENLSDKIAATAIAALSILGFLLGYLFIEKLRRERPLIGKVNELEKEMLVLVQENKQLSSKLSDSSLNSTFDPKFDELIMQLKQELLEANEARDSLELKVQHLTKELENSDELACEMNKVVTELLAAPAGIDNAVSIVENFQKQVGEQQIVISNINSQLSEKNAENEGLKVQLDMSEKKILKMSGELEKVMLNALKVEEEKEGKISELETEIIHLKDSLAKSKIQTDGEREKLSRQISNMKNQLEESERRSSVLLEENQLLKNSEGKDLIAESCATLAEWKQMHKDLAALKDQRTKDSAVISNLQKLSNENLRELETLRKKYEEADKAKVEALTKLEVLSSYFKDKEVELQQQLNKHESLWVERQGQATSTSEKLKFMQEELQNYKTQIATLQQEIVQQEIDLKSQLTVLEKKSHENWIAARQAERKLEDAKQEAAQLRNRLTLRERSLIEEKAQRLQSPLESNGELPPPPLLHPMDSPASPPLLYGARDHLSPSMPPPFPPPPPGAPFLHPLPPLPFIPPPPNLHPDQRPPPLGRMSSPPINPPFSPDSRYSPYEGNSPSPTDDEYYRPIRNYSPYNDVRREYRPPHLDRTNSRNKSGTLSPGSANSNDSVEKRYHSKV